MYGQILHQCPVVPVRLKFYFSVYIYITIYSSLDQPIDTDKTSFCCLARKFGPTHWLLLRKGSTDIGISIHVQWLTAGSPLWYHVS